MSRNRVETRNFSSCILYVSCFYRIINGWMKDRCVDMFSVLSRADNGQIGWKKYAACWNSRVPVNFRASGINSRDVESGAVSLAFVCLVDFYLILTTVKGMHIEFFFLRDRIISQKFVITLILTCMSYEKISSLIESGLYVFWNEG